MNGDYIYCLNPSCNMLSKDIHILNDSRNLKVRVMCPHCLGTNTVNANVILSQKANHQLILKTKKMTKAQVKDYAKELKKEGFIKRYKIQCNKSTHTVYLYDRTDIKSSIKEQAAKQKVEISKIESFK